MLGAKGAIDKDEVKFLVLKCGLNALIGSCFVAVIVDHFQWQNLYVYRVSIVGVLARKFNPFGIVFYGDCWYIVKCGVLMDHSGCLPKSEFQEIRKPVMLKNAEQCERSITSVLLKVC